MTYEFARHGVLPWRRRIEARIVGLFLLLLLLVQAASFTLIRHSIDRNARASIDAELGVGARVFDRLVQQHENNYESDTRLLAADYGLREAIASGDRETIVSALQNHGERIGAEIGLVTDPQFHSRAATGADGERFASLLRAFERDSAQAQPIHLVGGRPFQLVAAPVMAPILTAWVGMAFPVGRPLLDEIHQVSSLDAVLISRETRETRVVAATEALDGATDPLIAALAGRSIGEEGNLAVEIDGVEYSGRLVPLGRDADAEVDVVLLRSATEALAPYRRLQLTLLILVLAGVAVFGAGSVVTARRIADPIQSLSRAAAKIADGDDTTPVMARGGDEIGQLARTFETMRLAVRTRDENVRKLAYSDPLTDLPNRLQFTEQVGRAIDELRQRSATCAVLMLDLDRFKHINDVHGHAFGDRLLMRVARRLSAECLEPGDFLARLGGDEFAILSTGLDAAGTIAKGRRIANALDLPFALDDRTVDLGGSIGMALFPDDGATVHELLARAEIAMYAAKRRRSGILRYDRADDTSDESSLSLRGELRQALACDELRLYLQPKARVADGRIVGAEALIRWQHPQRGLVPPIQFIPFAEQIGFIRHLTAWVIEHAVKWLASVELPEEDFALSLNLSARDLLEADLAARVAEALARHGVAPERLCLEITESAVMEDFERALTTLQNLHQLGVRLSLDDYGTGYASLAYMSRLPIAELKIDKSFVLTMESDVRHADIVRSTIDLGHNLGLSVVAEGVETATAWQMLAGWGCDAVQGYLLGKPAPVEQFDLKAEAPVLSGSRDPSSPTAPAQASATA